MAAHYTCSRVIVTSLWVLLILSSCIVSCFSDTSIPASNAINSSDGTSSSGTEWGTATTSTAAADDCTNWEDYVKGSPAEDETTAVVDIAIIGAGPAGLAAAIGLTRSLPDGVKIRLYERAETLRNSSQGMVSLWPNGMNYLRRLHPELPELVTEAGCPFENQIFVKIDQDQVVTTKHNEPKPPEPGTVLIRWHALQIVLANLLPKDGDHLLMTGHSLMTYKELEDSVLLKFGNDKIVPAKIVIGADGTFSTVRQTMYPTDRPIYFGQMNWNAIIPTATLPAQAQPPAHGVKAVSYNGGEPRWSSYINDCGGNHTFFQLRITDAKKALSLSASKGRGGLGLPGVKKAILPIAQSNDDVANVLRAIPEEQLFERAIVGRLPAPAWRSPKGRVALLGDAAHAMHPNIGQGANSALGDAAVLVESITSCRDKDDKKNEEITEGAEALWLVEGLKQYETTRRIKVDWMHRIANMLGCGQASGEQWLESDAVSAWYKWTQNVDDSVPPPTEGRDIVEAFDPRSRTEVSLL
jgi:2-polyprenyl-6-methoxyphenol hydroxylase-like FAD-dependent oxidoreductase